MHKLVVQAPESVSSLPTHRYELIPSFKKLSCCLLGLKIKWYAAG